VFQSLSYFTPLRLVSLTLVLLLAIPPCAPAAPAPPPQQSPPIVLGCHSTNQFHILPTPCGPGTTINQTQVDAIFAWESQVLADYLATYGFPADQNQFYSWAGKDIRDEVRGFMYAELTALIKEPASQRNANEQAVVDWFQSWMTYIQVKVYTTAWAEYQKFVSAPCTYVIDGTINKAFGIQYDPLNCQNYGTVDALFEQPAQPSADYYKAFGIEAAYNPLGANPAVAETQERVSAYAEYALSASLVGATPPAAVLSSTAVFQQVAPFAARTFAELGEAAADTTFEFTAGFAATGAFIIVAIGLLVLIQGTIDFAEKQQVIDGLQTFATHHNSVIAPGFQYNLVSEPTEDKTDQPGHMMTAWSYLVSNSYDLPATVTPNGLFASTPGFFNTAAYTDQNNSINYDAAFQGSSASSNVAQVTSVDWAGRTWNIGLYGDNLFLKTCVSAGPAKDSNNNPLHPCYGPELTRSIETTYVSALPYPSGPGPITYFWESQFNHALISRTGGSHFDVKLYGVLGYGSPSDGYADCPIDPSTGISDKAGVFPACNGFVDNTAFLYTGTEQGKTLPFNNAPFAFDPTPFLYSRVTIVAPPAFSSASNVGFLGGTASTFHLAASSATAPSDPVTITRGACPGTSAPPDSIPSNTTFTPGLSNAASLSYDGSAVTLGNYNLTVCAQLDAPNGPSTTQTLTVTYGSKTGFISPTQLTVYSGIPFSKKIYTVGDPLPSLSVQNLTINDPFHFVNFQDNGDGSATVSGNLPYPFQLLSGICIPASILGPGTCPTVTASNVSSSATAAFNVTAVTAPAPSLILPPFNFVSGIPNTATISTYNWVTTPVLSALPQGTVLPLVPAAATSDTSVKTPLANYPWLTFKDNGNGTATLSGTPPEGLNTTIPLEIESNASWVVPKGTNITVNVAALPQITGPTNAIFQVGQGNAVNVTTANPATITSAPVALPHGVDVTGPKIDGIPAPQSGGFYPIPFTATNQYGTSNQTVNLYVMEPPTVSTTAPGNPLTIYVHAGAQTPVGISTVGYPKSPLSGGLPSEFATGMNITMTTNLPQSAYTFAGTTSPSGQNNGSGSINFTPTNSQAGQYLLTLDAANGVAPYGQLRLTINIVLAGDANHDGVVNCSDLTLVKNAFGQRYGQPAYDIRADVNLDGIVDIKDFTFVSAHLAPGTVCH
jgi:hypothetical protein